MQLLEPQDSGFKASLCLLTLLGKALQSQEWWNTSVIPALGKLRQKDHEVETLSQKERKQNPKKPTSKQTKKLKKQIKLEVWLKW
jgi:hypothetical protein